MRQYKSGNKNSSSNSIANIQRKEDTSKPKTLAPPPLQLKSSTMEEEEVQMKTGLEEGVQMKSSTKEEEEEIQMKKGTSTLANNKDEEEEEIQMKKGASTLANSKDEEEEEVQMKKGGATLANSKDEEEEEVQMKKGASTLANSKDEEEEEVQMKKGTSTLANSKDEEEEEVQMKKGGAASKKSKSTKSGTKMNAEVQDKMENSLQADFSEVNIVKDSQEASQAGALAYTQGNDIHFAPGKYNQESKDGQELLGHELTHVIQQRDGIVEATKKTNGLAVNDNDGLEKEADDKGKLAAEGKVAEKETNKKKKSTEGGTTTTAQFKKADPDKRWNQKDFFDNYSDKIDNSTLTANEIQYFKDYGRRAEIYLRRPNRKWTDSNLKGDMFANAAMKTYLKFDKDITKVVPLEFALTQGQFESHLGITGRSAEKNPYNVGEYDDKSAPWVSKIQSPQQGITLYYDLMAEDYLSTKTPDQLIQDGNFTNETGNRYASNTAYESDIRNQISVVSSYINKNDEGHQAVDLSKPEQVTTGPSEMDQLVDAVYSAMKGLTTNEAIVYNALAKLEKDSGKISEFKDKYKAKYGSDVVADIKSEFSNTWMFGDELDKALSLLNVPTGTKEESVAKKAKKVESTEQDRKDNKLDNVHLKSSKDNNFTASRWENKDGSKTKYAEEFDEKIKLELKTEFGKDITHAEVVKLIQDAEKAGDEETAAEYRKKLFRANQYAVVEALDVDKKGGSVSGKNALNRAFTSTSNHEMYGRTKGATYCNIYAYDVVTALGGYLPRMWWDSKTEKKAIEAHEQGKDFNTTPVYGTNTKEMNANALTSWMPRIGSKYFSWRKASNMEAAQNAANEGNIVILLAANKVASRSGHVNVILAERDQHKAVRKDDKVTLPMQSQAGGANFKYKANKAWWKDSNHKDGAAWIYDGKAASHLLKPEEVGLKSTVSKDAKENATTTETGKSVANRRSPRTSTSSAQETFEYPVKSGEGLSKLAEKHGVSVEALKELNRDLLKTWGTVTGFEAGAKIKVPKTSSN